MDWLRQNRCFWKPSTCHQAAKAGQLGVLKWAREKGCPWGPSTFYEAAKAGHWPILEYLASPEVEEDRCPWNERLCQGCAEGGHLAILTWARSAGCPWNENTIAKFAAINGHLDILQYAWDQGVCLALCVLLGWCLSEEQVALTYPIQAFDAVHSGVTLSLSPGRLPLTWLVTTPLPSLPRCHLRGVGNRRLCGEGRPGNRPGREQTRARSPLAAELGSGPGGEGQGSLGGIGERTGGGPGRLVMLGWKSSRPCL